MEGTTADTDNIDSPMLLKQSIFRLAIEQFTVWTSGSSRVIVLQLLFPFSVPPHSKISHRSCAQPLFHTFRHSSLLNTSLKDFNLFLFKIMLYLNHQNPCLCQIQLVLFCLQLTSLSEAWAPASSALRWLHFLSLLSLPGWVSTCECWTVSGLSLGLLSPSFSLMCFCISFYFFFLMKILK